MAEPTPPEVMEALRRQLEAQQEAERKLAEQIARNAQESK